MTGPRVTCKVSSDVPGKLAGGRQGGIWGPLIREHHGGALGCTREFNFVVTVSRRVSGGDAPGAGPAGVEFIRVRLRGLCSLWVLHLLSGFPAVCLSVSPTRVGRAEPPQEPCRGAQGRAARARPPACTNVNECASEGGSCGGSRPEARAGALPPADRQGWVRSGAWAQHDSWLPAQLGAALPVGFRNIREGAHG